MSQDPDFQITFKSVLETRSLIITFSSHAYKRIKICQMDIKSNEIKWKFHV
jgi:hypothetical protein